MTLEQHAERIAQAWWRGGKAEAAKEAVALFDAGALAMQDAVLDHASFAVIGDTVRFIAADDVRAIDPATLRGVSHD